MFSKDDLLLIQAEAKRQYAIATERQRAAADARAEIEAMLNPLLAKQAAGEKAQRAVAPLMQRWGKLADGTVDPNRPMTRKKLDDLVAAYREAQAEADARIADLRTRLKAAGEALANAAEEKSKLAAALTDADTALRSSE